MSVPLSPSGYVGADVSAVSRNWPGGIGAGAPATVQKEGVAMPGGVAASGVSGGASATMPWVTCIAILLVIRLLSHVRAG